MFARQSIKYIEYGTRHLIVIPCLWRQAMKPSLLGRLIPKHDRNAEVETSFTLVI